MPKDCESFARISGVGSAKLEQFSGPFLEAIAEHAAINRSTTEEDGNSRKDSRGPRKLPGPTLEETKGLLQQGLCVAEISERRGLARSTITGHLEQLVTSGEELDLDHLMPSPERFEKIESAFQQIGTQYLAPVWESLGEDYSYDELALVRIGLRHRGLLD